MSNYMYYLEDYYDFDKDDWRCEVMALSDMLLQMCKIKGNKLPSNVEHWYKQFLERQKQEELKQKEVKEFQELKKQALLKLTSRERKALGY